MDFILNEKLKSFKFRRYTFLPSISVSVTNDDDICDLLKNVKVKPVNELIIKKEITPLFAEIEPKENQLKIGALRVGGLGDTLQLGAHACAIKRKFPDSFLTVYVRDGIDLEVMQYNKYVNKICKVGVQGWDDIVEREKNKHDIFYDFRYAVKVFFNTNDYIDYKISTEKMFKEYKTIYKDFCKSNYKIERFEMNLIDFSNMVACLDGDENDMTFDLKDNYIGYAKVLEKQKYITIHVSAGKFRKTKSWFTDRWNIVVDYLIKKGYTVIQLGEKGEPLINGSIDLTGISIQETGWLLKGAQFHIDTEGGVVHLAKAVKTPSIVIFGSTPVESFGYKENINLRTKECAPCWYKTEDWYIDCPEGHNIKPKCLDLISVDIVKEAIDNFEKKYREKRVEIVKNNIPIVSIIMPVHNQLKYLEIAISSILNYTQINFEIIIIDNGSGKEVKDFLNKFQYSKIFTVITNKKNLGFSKANNQGADIAKGKYLCLLNNDVRVGKDWLEKLIEGLEGDNNLGMVGVSGGKLDSECRCVGVVRKNDQIYNYLEGWCLLVKKNIFHELAGFDEDFSPAFSEDADLSFRLKRSGYKTKIIENVSIQHYGNKTVFSQSDFDVKKVSLVNSKKFKEKKRKIEKGIL